MKDILDFEFESLGFESLLFDTDFMLQPTTEGYVIKSKYIAEMEKCVTALHDSVKNASELELSIKASALSTNPNVKELELLLQKEFGFGWIDINIDASAYINAVTVPNSAIIGKITRSIPQLPVEHGGRYYDSNHERFVFINFTAGTIAKLEPDEIMAIMLHEIGHVFDITLTTFLVDLVLWILAASNGVGAIFGRIIEPLKTLITLKGLQWLDYLIIPAILKNLLFIGNTALSKVLGPLGGVTQIASICTTAMQNFSLKSFVPFANFAGERFADSFVTAYGYGDALIRALDKVDQKSYSTGTNKFFEVWSWSGGALIVPLMILIDPHPETQTRCKMILEDCEKAMKDPTMPKKMRPIAQQRYKIAKKAYENYLAMPDEEQANAGARFARATKEKLFGGKLDFRSYIFKLSAALTKNQ